MDKSDFNITYFDKSRALSLLPCRAPSSNKGDFGKALIIAGSPDYIGAAHLAIEAALRAGAGYVGYLNEAPLCDISLLKFPEVIYHRASLLDTEKYVSIAKGYRAILVGPGLSVNEAVARLVASLIKSEGATLVIDADGLNSISRYLGADIFLERRREIVITPHPLEFARLLNLKSSNDVNSDRVGLAVDFAKKYGITVLLKGQSTVVTDGEATYINTTGSVALAKGGTGDVLAGLLTSLSAYMKNPTDAAILSAYLHGRAGDLLSECLSTFGILPSELPTKIAEVLSELENHRKL